MTLAILCSGQGRQNAGMFSLTGDAPEAADLFAHAATLLGGRDPRALVRAEGSEALHRDRVGQILCSLQALAAAAALRDALPERIVIAGYSIGEVAAWGVAGLIGSADVLDLVVQRAEAMDAASPPGDGMLFVRGLARETIEALCGRHDAAIAIVSPGNAFVLGGNREALHRLGAEARALRSTNVVDVPVEVASHTLRLAKASAAFREKLGRVRVAGPLPEGMRLLSGIDAEPVFDVGAGLEKLAVQISRTVQWADCLNACLEAGGSAFLELGPGSALSGMVAGAYHDVATRSLDDFRTLQGLRDWLARQVAR